MYLFVSECCMSTLIVVFFIFLSSFCHSRHFSTFPQNSYFQQGEHESELLIKYHVMLLYHIQINTFSQTFCLTSLSGALDIRGLQSEFLHFPQHMMSVNMTLNVLYFRKQSSLLWD